MPALQDAQEGDLLAAWIDGKKPRTRHRGCAVLGGLRFAFYGRVSTRDHQDPVSSQRWQLDVATDLIAGRGRIVVEFFDVGCTRELSWIRRPQAAALLAALADPDRGFDAVVVGEYARAFSGSQLAHLADTLRRHGVELWIPETDGPLDFDDVTHQALVMMLGAQARREVQRARFRTTMAMQAQAREQGRYLGGRPPYGYRLVDAGPHPNRVHAQWGRRLHRLEPNPDTAPHVAWIFAQRLAGRSIAGIGRALNEMGVPCPSAADPARNPHRRGDGWRLRTVAAILANPRYTGRQVWNRQRSDRQSAQDELPGLLQVRRLAARAQWTLSVKPAHPALVSEQDFIAAQAVSALPQAADGTKRTYLLAGLLRCALCGRSLESQWSHGNPCHRCRHGHTTADEPTARQAANLHLRQDVIIARVQAQLPQISSDDPQARLRLAHVQATSEPGELARFLNAYAITVICDQRSVALETDSTQIMIRRDIRRTIPAPKIPRQRSHAAAKQGNRLS